MRRPCAYFNKPGGCRKGDSCDFAHVGAPGSSVHNNSSSSTSQGSSSAGRGGRGRGQHAGRGRGPAAFGRGGGGGGFSSGGHDGAFSQLLSELGCSLDPQPLQVQRWVQLALQRCEGGSAGQVLQVLKRDDGSNLLRAVGQQIGVAQNETSSDPAASRPLLCNLVPLLKLLMHEEVRTDPLHSNPVLSTLHNSLSLSAVSAALQQLSATTGSSDDTFIRRQVQQAGGTGMAMPCLPQDWLDVLQPLTTYLQEVTSRFSASLKQNPDSTLKGAATLIDALTAAMQQHLPAGSPVAVKRTTDWRRLLTSLQLLQRQLNAQQDNSRAIERLQAMQEQQAARQKQQAGVGVGGSSSGPGELSAEGRPRHENDRVCHLEVSVAPTRGEVLCKIKPFLPPNRPGSLPHAAHDPDRAHRELHFRLLRHDVVGPVCDAAQAFMQFGGVAGLRTIKGQTPGYSTRLHLRAGRDVQDIYVFRNVTILSLTSAHGAGGGIAYTIEFDDAPQLANTDFNRRRIWWKQTKQLQHGSLVALYWDATSSSSSGSSNPTAGGSSSSATPVDAPLPNMMFATVCERDEKVLAGGGQQRRRPQLGIRMCGQAVTAELMAAVLGRQRLGYKNEVVLLPAAGSFFAYEPILKALQATHPLPLARYILHAQTGADGPERQQQRTLPVLFQGELVGGASAGGGAAGSVEVPAYAAGAECVYDMTPVASQDKMKNLSTDELRRLQRVCISSPDSFPLDLLKRATTLDDSQAAALVACLTKELAVVQGPPGCGKTYIGVQLVCTLLANTRNSLADRKAADIVGSSVPLSKRPDIGPILVLCYTNHALDSFLLDLVHCGIDEGIIRVGRRSSCEALERYNLFKQEGGRAGGREVGSCRRRVEELREDINRRLEKVQASRTAKRLRWSDVEESLYSTHPALLESFYLRASVMDEAVYIQALTGSGPDSDGFQQAPSGRRGKRGKNSQQQQVVGGANWGWVWGADVLQDWYSSSPLFDWQRQQWIMQRHQQWEADAARGFGGEPDADAAGAGSSGSSMAGGGGPREAGAGAADNDGHAAATIGSTISAASTSNPFAALVGLEEGEESVEAVLEQLQRQAEAAGGAAADTTTNSGSASSNASGYEPLSFSTGMPAAGGGASATAPQLPSFADWALLSQTGSLASSSTAPLPPPPRRKSGRSAAGDAAAAESDDDGWEMAELSDSDDGGVSTAAGSTTSTTANSVISPASTKGTRSQAQTPRPDRQHAAAAAGASSSSSSPQQPSSPPAAADTDLVDDDAAALAGGDDEAAPPAWVQELEGLGRPVEELLLLEDVNLMSRPERRRLYQHWLNSLANQWGVDIQDRIEELETEQKRLQALYNKASLEVLRGARIVGMTTTGLANKQDMLHGLSPKVVIVEEAAEVLEAHILTSLSPSVEHLVLIGDHLQLPPKVEVYELQKESGRGYNLNTSMFERLVEAGTVQHVTLAQQRRMRPDISELIRGPLYPQLRDHPAVLEYPHVRGMAKDLFFWDHDHKEGGTDQSKSRYNDYEVKACVQLARYLLQQGYGGKDGQPAICILTPYVGQLLRLRQAVAEVADLKFVLSSRDETDLGHVITDSSAADSPLEFESSSTGVGGSSPRAAAGAVGGGGGGSAVLSGAGSEVVTLGQSLRLATIDNFQGEEAQIIILSLVRNPREQGAGIGFLAVNNRINVLLSRAKEGMYLVGSSAALYAAADKAEGAGRPCMWRPVLDHLSAQDCMGKSLQVCCQRHNNITDITKPDEFASLVGDGGCQQACGRKLPCGHICPRRCHADDPLHTQTKCWKPCGKLCARGRHACELLCYQPCNACNALEESVELPCGHIARNVPCCKAGEPDKIPCREQVRVTYPGCGHRLTVPCGRREAFASGAAACTQEVQVTLPGCGHTVKLPCGKAALALLAPTACTDTCGGLLQGCQHVCSSKCGRCMQLLLQGSSSSSSAGGGGNNADGSAGGDGRAANSADSFVGRFVTQLQTRSRELYELWSNWLEKSKTAVQQEQLPAQWMRFLTDVVASELGTAQCRLLSVPVSGSSTSSSSGATSSSSVSWEAYVNHCRTAVSSSISKAERLAAEWQAALQGAANNTSSSSSTSGSGQLLRPHTPCSKLCDKPLACGHSCTLKCHHGSRCGPCKQPCSIACDHTKCHQPCAAPCSPCAEPCSWRCPHHGACLLPCGVPCDRQPCNLRCSNLLKCGHRCPGLCGEACLPQKFCVHPACMAKASAATKERVVDMLLFKTFGELTDADVSADPLILLPCGHLFSTSTLDGHMGMSEAYERMPAGDSSSSSSSAAPPNSSSTGGSGGGGGGNSNGGGDGSSSSAGVEVPSDLEPWGAPLHRTDFAIPKGCPDCRRLIAGVKRYGRVVLHSMLGVTQRKHAEAIRLNLGSSRSQLTQLQKSVLSPSAPWRENTSLSAADRLIKNQQHLAKGLLSELGRGRAEAWNVGLRFMQLTAAVNRTPKQHVLASSQASILTAAKTGHISPHAAFQRVAALKGLDIKPDQQMAYEATQSRASAMQLCLNLDTCQLEVLAAALQAVDSAMSTAAVTEDLFAGEAGFGGGGGRRGAGGRGRGRGAKQTGWLAAQRRELQTQVTRILGESLKLFSEATRDVRWAIDAAAGDACYPASYRLSHSLMLLLVERASQLQPLKKTVLTQLVARQAARDNKQGQPLAHSQAAPAAAVADQERQLWEMQVQLLQQAEHAGTAALRLFGQQKQQLVQQAGDDAVELQAVLGMTNEAVSAVQQLLGKLPEIKDNLSDSIDAAEVASVLAALMQAEGHYYSNLGLESFMAGHLYECPNGHLFVIGECGGAMQESRCDRCGARVGGRSHQLDPTNRRVGDSVRAAVVQAAAGLQQHRT